MIEIGFSAVGLCIVLLPMLPNVLYLKKKPQMKPQKDLGVLDVVENVFRFTMMLCFILLKPNVFLAVNPWTFLAVLFLLAYDFAWTVFFLKDQSYPVRLSLAVLPVCYFVFAAFWIGNLVVIVPAALFGIVHLIVTYLNR